MENNYKLYLHVFPNGKKYVGCTSKTLKDRWNGGRGYMDHSVMFSAILEFGWSNVHHYLLMDGLSKEEALLYEAAYIDQWKTYTQKRGYNVRHPQIEGMDEIKVPSFIHTGRRKVKDISKCEPGEYYQPKRQCEWKWKKVRCLETGEIFENADEASVMYGKGSRAAIYSAIHNGNASGTCYLYDEESDMYYPVPAHWEYVDE